MDEKLFRKKVMGCWLGKAIGGTLGQPYEGCDGPLNLSFYDPVPTDMVPNDDLDLQVLWCYVLDRMEHPMVDRKVFADAWLNHVDFPWDEYGVAIRNLKMGIPAPYSGSFDNWFTDGLGAAIRSELWACLAPGDPALAARYAYEDACVDHAGNGIYAEQFWAAVESQAFVESDLDKLLDCGLSVIPEDCRFAQMVRDTRAQCAAGLDPMQIRAHSLECWGSESFTNCVMNGAFTIMALMLGKGDFGKTICLAVNCGRDADCSTATAGALLGLIDPDGIEKKWLAPIGRKLVLNAGIRDIRPPKTLDDFTDQVIALRQRISLRDASLKDPEPDWSKYTVSADCGFFAPWFHQDDNRFKPVMPETTFRKVFPGNLGTMDAGEIPPDRLLMMRFRFRLDVAHAVRIMFNTNANSRVWVDGEYAFGREGGRMAPSPHRAPCNQFRNMELAAGTHEIIAGIAPMDGTEKIQWVISVADQKSRQWIPVKWL